MKVLAADGIPSTVTCRVLQLARPVTRSELVETRQTNSLFDAYLDAPEFGHRLRADEARAAGESMTGRTAWGIGSANGGYSASAKRSRGERTSGV